MTRDDAISIFQTKSSDYYYGGDSDKDAGINPLDPAATGPATPAAPGSTDGGAHAQALQAVYLSNVLVYPDTPNEEKDDKNKKKVTKINSNTSDVVTPELEEWRCYGSTEVDLLVLRPDTGKAKYEQDTNSNNNNSEEETIAAISPYTAPGMQVRDITTSTFGKERTRTIRLGILEIVYSTVMDAVDDSEEDAVNSNLPNQPNKESNSNPTLDGRKSSSKNNDENENAVPLSTPERVYQSAQSIAKHMESNAKLLYESTQENFPERTVEASKRIYEEMPHTLERTISMMKKMVHYFGGQDGDDEGSDDNSHGRPRRR